jgi:hypothetical protein
MRVIVLFAVAPNHFSADDRCAPQNYSGGGKGQALPRLLRPVGFGPEHRAIVPLFYSSRRCEVASSSTQSSSV